MWNNISSAHFCGFYQRTAVWPLGVEAVAADRFGNYYSARDIRLPLATPGGQFGGGDSCDCAALGEPTGFFELTFADCAEGASSIGFHPDADVSGDRKRAVCRAFADLAALIVPATAPAACNAPAASVRVLIDVSNLAFFAQQPTALAVASPYYPFVTEGVGTLTGFPWRVINGGTESFYNLAGVYHGFAAFRHPGTSINLPDWYTNPASPIPATSNLRDLYTAALHEALHILGFGSNMDGSGQSILDFSSGYTRYDQFLFLSDDRKVITNNPPGSYQFGLNVPASDLFRSCQDQNGVPGPDLVFRTTNSAPSLAEASVYTSDAYNGSSFSHLQIGCDQASTPDYLMHLSLPAGTSRNITPIELQILADLGYQVPGYSSCSLAGVDDVGVTCSGKSLAMAICPGGSNELHFTASDLISNDPGATGLINLAPFRDIDGTLVPDPAVTDGYIFTPERYGVHILRYIPTGTGANGCPGLGNETFVLIEVRADNSCFCTFSDEAAVNCGLNNNPWNLVCNPEFCAQEGVFAGTNFTVSLSALALNGAELPGWLDQFPTSDYATAGQMTSGSAFDPVLAGSGAGSFVLNPPQFDDFTNGPEALATPVSVPAGSYFYATYHYQPRRAELVTQLRPTLVTAAGQSSIDGENETVAEVEQRLGLSNELFQLGAFDYPIQQVIAAGGSGQRGVRIGGCSILPAGETYDYLWFPSTIVQEPVYTAQELESFPRDDNGTPYAQFALTIDQVELLPDNFAAPADRTAGCGEVVTLGGDLFSMLSDVEVRYTWLEDDGNGNLSTLLSYDVKIDIYGDLFVDGQAATYTEDASGVVSDDIPLLEITPSRDTRYVLRREVIDDGGIDGFGFCVSEDDTFVALTLPGLSAAFTAQACNLEVQAIAQTYENATHSWTMGDGTTLFGATVNHTYASAGTYAITHTLEVGGCTLSNTQTVTVPDQTGPTTAAFTLQQSGSCTGILHDIVLVAADPFWTHTYTVGGVTYNGPELTIQLGTGTHTITHTMSNACGSLTSQQTISLADCFECADCDPASVVGTPGQVITLTQAINLGQLPAAQADGISRCIAGTLLLEAGDGYSFTGANIRMYPGAEIVVQNGALFNSEKSSVFYACDGLWQGIRVEAGAQVKVSDSYFVQAYTAFDLEPSIDAELPGQLSDVQLIRSVFQDNFVGLYVRARGELAALNAVIVDNDFRAVDKLLPSAQITPFPNSSSGGLPLATLPPAGAYAYAGMIVHDLSLLASTRNNFRGTVNGVLAFDAELTVTQNTFSDQIVRRTDYLGFRNATGLSMRRTGQRIAKLFASDNDFHNAAIGIDGYFGTLDAQQNTMEQVEAGILVNLPPDTDVTISNNSLKCLRNGITARGLLTNGKLRIENNTEISISAPLHITDAAVRLRGIESEDAIIRNNPNILVPDLGSGIDVQSCKNLVLENNTIALSNSSLALAGIRLRGCDNLLLSDNTVNGSSTSGGTGNIGLQVISSANIFYCQNDFDQTRYGVTVAGSSNSADLFRANTFNQHSTGLLITPGSLLGGQNQQENCWAGNYGSGFGAVYEVSLQDAQRFPFIIDDRFVSCYNTMESPDGWFDPRNNATPQNFRNRNRCDYIDFPRQKDDDKIDEVAALIQGGSSLQNLHTSIVWQARYAAYERYLGNPQDYNLATSQAAQQLANGSIGAYRQFMNQLKQATQLDTTTQDSLAVYAATQAQQMAQWVQADLALAVSGALELTSVELANRRQLAASNLQTNLAQQQVVHNLYLNRASQLAALNVNALPANQTVTNKLKLPLQVAVQRLLSPWITPSSADLQALDNLAYECPLTDGNGVFRARSLLALYEEEPDYPDACVSQASLQALPPAVDEQNEEITDLSIFPNPGNSATVELRYPMRETPGTLYLMNSYGLIVQQWQLPADQTRFNLPIQKLPNGLYFVHWSQGNDQLVEKLIINH